MIKFGDINYFTLINLQDKLKYVAYDKLDLNYLDKLRMEVDIKVEQIHLEDKIWREEQKAKQEKGS